MELPVLFKHEFEEGVVSRIKQYEIKAHQFFVDLDEDAKVFVNQFHVVAEGQRAIELSTKPVADDAESDADKVKPKQSNKAAASKDKSAAK